MPAAFVELDAGSACGEEELIDYCRGTIAAFKVPRYVRFVDGVADVRDEDPEARAPGVDPAGARARAAGRLMQHRIIVVETLPEVPVAAAQAHWRDRHVAVYAPAPLLLGYVQNRPLEEEWPRLGLRTICSETWFADRDVGAGVVRERLLPRRRDAGRGALPRPDVRLDGAVRRRAGKARSGRARYRVLAFGAEAMPGADADVLEVDREPWAGGEPRVLSLWLDDRARALELARATPSFAFAAEPAIVVAPPA